MDKQKKDQILGCGCLAIALILGVTILPSFFRLGSDGKELDDSEMRDFADNPQNYKGKIVTLKVQYQGDGMRQLMSNDAIARNMSIRFDAFGVVHGVFTFYFYVDVVKGLKCPPLNYGDHALVTFKCTSGSLSEGNQAIKIARP